MVLRSWIATLLLIAVTVLPARGQDKPKIYFGASSKTLGYGPLWVAVKKGFLEQQGLDGQLVLLRGTPMNVQALAANSLQVGSGGAEAFYEASERGLDLVMIGGIINGLTHDIIAGKKYKSIEDLRGATFGASSLTSGTVTAMKQALKAKGLEYPRDYKILVLAGGSSANLAALQSGQIAATTVAIPAKLCCRGKRSQRRRPAHRCGAGVRIERIGGETILGGKKPLVGGALHESHRPDTPLDV